MIWHHEIHLISSDVASMGPIYYLFPIPLSLSPPGSPLSPFSSLSLSSFALSWDLPHPTNFCIQLRNSTQTLSSRNHVSHSKPISFSLYFLFLRVGTSSLSIVWSSTSPTPMTLPLLHHYILFIYLSFSLYIILF